MMNDKCRTQLYLDEAQYWFLKESAAKYNTSIAGVVRALIDKEMESTELVDECDPLFRIANTAVTTGLEDGSTDHDRHIYRSGSVGSSRRGAPPQKRESPR